MRTSQAFFWFGLVFVHHRVVGLPALSSSTDPSRDIHSADLEAADYHQNSRAEVQFGRDLGRISTRSGVPPKKGGALVPVPQTPGQNKGKGKQDPPGAPDKGKGKADTPDNDKGKGKQSDPETPNPSKGGRDKVYQLGKCGTELAGDSIKNVDPKTGKSPKRQPKTPKPPRTPKASKAKNRPDNDNDNSLPPVTGKKDMQVCGTKVDMIFPDYPSSGDAIDDKQLRDVWKDKLVAYNAEVIDPCEDDYRFGKQTYPSSKSDGIHTYRKPDKKGGKGHTKDIWQTEHVMDAQILKKFFQDMFQDVTKPEKKDADIKRTEVPKQWVSSSKGKAADQNQCSYLEQFWTKRWVSGKENAMRYLLSEFPGAEQYGGEMLLFPGRLNNKKNQLFGIDGNNVISTDKFEKMSLHQRIDELRELILLIEYLNTPDVAKYFKALSLRIRDRLAVVDADGTAAYMRKTDDWWFKQKGDQELKDADDEKYKSVRLASRWSIWINAFVKERTVAMQNLLIELTWVVERDWEDAKTYAEMSEPKGKAFNKDFEARLRKLKQHTKKSVNLRSYVIGSVSRPGTPDPSDSEGPGDGSSDSDLPETPTKPKPNTQLIPSLPDRTRPNPGASTP